MRYIADFHIHSKYSRATSQQMDVPNIAKWAKKKGINIIGTGDWTHPGWLAELKENLEPAEEGLYKPKSGSNVRYILTTEIALIYSQGSKLAKIHHLIFVPSFETVDKINAKLGRIGNLWADGRPILGLSSKDLVKLVMGIDPSAFIAPAHAWTPWFSVFGSNSGFNSLDECFGEMVKEVFVIETGLSSDPAMNWRLSALDRITLISNSDSHSGPKLGREANVFEIDPDKLSFSEIRRILKEKDKKNFLFTIEFFPQEGKYHYDGHRVHGISFSPQESKKHQGKCPVCGKPLTIGVMNRVDQLADRKEGYVPENAIPAKHLVPLEEIIIDVRGVAGTNQKIRQEYDNLVSVFGSEITILLDTNLEDLEKLTSKEVVEGIRRVREGKVDVKPGYDGVYGKISILGKKKDREEITEIKTEHPQQASLF